MGARSTHAVGKIAVMRVFRNPNFHPHKDGS
jgi:hypothetical protein